MAAPKGFNGEKAEIILRILMVSGPSSVDQFVTTRNWYVNSWAPTFTHLRKAGLVERTGRMVPTTHGSEAHELRVTEAGRAWYREHVKELVPA